MITHHHIFDAPGLSACIDISRTANFQNVTSRIFHATDAMRETFVAWSAELMTSLIDDPRPLSVKSYDTSGKLYGAKVEAWTEEQAANLRRIEEAGQ